MPAQPAKARSPHHTASFSRARRKRPDPRDIEVGQRVRALRLERGMSQSALATQLGLTFQQVQKYEKGTNRIGASRLQTIAEIFQVPIGELFASSAPKAQNQNSIFELIDSAAALRLLRAYNGMSSKMKQALVQMAVA
ncbi:MAG: helix-turn-helix domain-containing protein, partial [Terriglobia bacterium]